MFYVSCFSFPGTVKQKVSGSSFNIHFASRNKYPNKTKAGYEGSDSIHILNDIWITCSDLHTVQHIDLLHGINDLNTTAFFSFTEHVHPGLRERSSDLLKLIKKHFHMFIKLLRNCTGRGTVAWVVCNIIAYIHINKTYSVTAARLV